MRPQALQRLAVLALAASGCLWGTSFLFGKLALASLDVSQVVLYRFFLASLVLLPAVILNRIRLNIHDLPLFLLTGILTVPVTFLVQFAGLKLTSAAVAALIIGTLPALLALAARVFFHEKLDKVGWGAIGMSSFGVLLIVGLPNSNNNWLGDGLVFLSLFAVVAWTFLGKRLAQEYSSVIATAYIFAFGTITLLPISLWWDGTPRLNLSANIWLAVVILGIACSAATTVLWNWGLQHFPTPRAGLFLNLEPFVGMLLGILVLHERISPLALVGGALILGAAVIISLQKAPAQEPQNGNSRGYLYSKSGRLSQAGASKKKFWK